MLRTDRTSREACAPAPVAALQVPNVECPSRPVRAGMSFAFKRDFDWNERAVPADLTIEIGAGRGVDRPETVADRLNELDAHMVRWQPAVRGEPARATFTFDSEAARAEFVARMAAYATVRVVS